MNYKILCKIIQSNKNIDNGMKMKNVFSLLLIAYMYS